jgi:hypothetical protein
MSNFYSEFSVFLLSAVKKDDLAVASALLEHVMPEVDQTSIDQIESIRKSVLMSGSKEMMALFMRHHTIKDEDAFTYISSRIINKSLERSELDSMIGCVGKFYGVGLAGSIATGDFEILEKLKSAHAGKTVTAVFSNNSSRGIVIDNVFFRGENYSQPSLSREKLIRLIDEAQDLGLMLETESEKYARNYLFDSNNLSAINEWETIRCKQLPIISKGVIKNPELIMAFDEHAQRHPAMEKMYNRVPVFIAASELEDYPLARAFHQSCKVIAYIGDGDVRSINRQHNKDSFSEFNLQGFFSEYDTVSSEEKDALMQRVDSYEISIRANDASSENKESVRKDELIISKIAPEQCLTGFMGKDKLVLCMVDVHSAMGLEMSDFSQENMTSARYIAHTLITPETVSGFVCRSNYNYIDEQVIAVRESSLYSNKLIRFISGGEIAHKAVIDNLGKDLMLNLINKSWGSMNGHDHAFMQREYGLTAPKSFRIEEKRFVGELHESGYKFQAETKYEVNVRSINDVDTHLKLIEMGCWPDNTVPIPEDLSGGLKASVRKPENAALTAFLLHHGAEAVCRVAKSLPQWERVRKLFHDQPETVARFAPNLIKRELLSGSMDI